VFSLQRLGSLASPDEQRESLSLLALLVVSDSWVDPARRDRRYALFVV